MIKMYDLKLASGKIVQWNGEDGEDAARKYVAEHPGATVVATRLPRYPLTVLGRGVIIN